MNLQFALQDTDDWSISLGTELKSICNRLICIPKLGDIIQKIRKVIILQNHNPDDSATLGTYSPLLGYIRIFSNRIKTLEEAIYVLLHEVGHHVADMRTGINKDYNSKEPNEAYYKEEARADSMAISLMKKYFNHTYNLSTVIENAIKRLKFMYSRYEACINGWYFDDNYIYKISSSITNWEIEGWNSGSFGKLALAA